MNITIVGTGYVGLISGVCLAAKGHHVCCVDTNSSTVQRLNSGHPTIYERGLPELLTEVHSSGRFRATTELEGALGTSEIVLIAVGTPSSNGEIDLEQVRTAARQIGSYINTSQRHISIVVKSTVVPGTTDTVVKKEIEKASGKQHGDFGLGMNPEFLREGNAIEDFMYPDRIVFGHEDKNTLHRLETMYAPWQTEKLHVNSRTAELIKYSNNALLAVQISAINEIANLAAALGGIDVMDVARGVHLDKRWSPIVSNRRITPPILTYLVPGCGFGGSCFPKDVQAIRTQGMRLGLPMEMLNAVLAVNESQPQQVINIIEKDTGSLAGRTALVLGLAFKPDTDDVRESASLKIIASLLGKGSHVLAHDPIATENFKRAMGPFASEVEFLESWRERVRDADIIILATQWPEYAEINSTRIEGKTIFDARRMLTPDSVARARYLSIGRRMA